LRERLRENYDERRALREERDALRAGATGLWRAEFARYALGEIEAAALEDGEDERLRERREILGNAERIANALTSARARSRTNAAPSMHSAMRCKD